MGFRKPKFEIGVLRTKYGHRGMKNEIQEVGYQKRSLIGGVRETRFRVWVLRTKTQNMGTMIQYKSKGYLKRGFEMGYIVLS